LTWALDFVEEELQQGTCKHAEVEEPELWNDFCSPSFAKLNEYRALLKGEGEG
jgi:hypothetical protein